MSDLAMLLGLIAAPVDINKPVPKTKNGGTGRLIDLIGQRFGRLTVIEKLPAGERRHAMWLCRCECGRKIAVQSNNLRSGATKSCGCATRKIYE